MKNLGVFLSTVLVVILMAAPSHAALKTITFDDSGFVENDRVTTQFTSSLGITFSDDDRITGPLDTSGEYDTLALKVESKNSGVLEVSLNFFSDSIEFLYRREKKAGVMDVDLYNSGQLVVGYDLYWDPDVHGKNWLQFSYTGDLGQFNQIFFSSRPSVDSPTGTNFDIDNFQVNSVPVPASLLLFLSGAIPVMLTRRKKNK
ncbi:MAG: PEP-CTERM sorting domain-containing protein [Desulfobacteraceae bacterium]|nr:PEP-CTERM sorting domain-containing protein [Desulfobacteraceae bacterium]